MDGFDPDPSSPDGGVFVIDEDEPDRPARDDSPPRRIPVGGRIAAVAGVAAVFAFGLAVGRTGLGAAPREPEPVVTTSTVTISPTSSPPASTGEETGGATTSSTTPIGVLNEAFDAAAVLPGADFKAVTAAGDQLVALAPARLVRIATSAAGDLHPAGTANVGLPIGDPTYADWELVGDGHVAWALSLTPTQRLYAVDPSTLRLGPLIGAPTGPTDAAALNGHLYLNTDVGVFDLAPSTRPGDEPQVVARGGQAMAVDPARNRLLVLNLDGGWVIHGYDLSEPGSPVVEAPLPFEARDVAVAGDEIWVTGLTNDEVDRRPVIARLDPTSLRVTAHSGLEESLTSVPTVAAAGAELWLRTADDPDALWRLDAGTGSVVQQWAAVPGLVVVTADQAFVIEGNVIGRLRLDAHTR